MSVRRRSVVRTSGLIPGRGRPTLFAYGFADLAVLLGSTTAAVRKAVQRGAFDPGSLASVLEYAQKRRSRDMT